MSLRSVEPELTHSPAAVAPAAPRLRGWRLLLARTVWLTVSFVAVGLFIASIPPTYEQTVAFSPSQVYAPEALRAGLEQLGIPIVAYALYEMAVMTFLVMVFVGVGAFVFWRRSDDPAALYFSLVSVTFGAIWPNTLDSLPEQPILDFLNAGLNAFGFAAFFLLFYLFPDGRFVPRWTRPFAVAFVASVTLDTFFSGTIVDTETWGYPYDLIGETTQAIVFFGTMFYAQIYRYRRVSTRVQRQQTKWVSSALIVAVVCFLVTGALEEASAFTRPGAAAIFDIASSITYGFSFMLVPLSIGMAVLRYRLWDIDPIVNRVLVYGALTACVAGIYVFVVGYLGGLLRTGDNLFVSFVATGVVAVFFAPLRDKLQRGVNRLMYGERDEPYEVISRLSRRLEATLEPRAVLPAIVSTVKEALKLPYAAIELKQKDGFAVVASEGDVVEDPFRLPLMYQNEPVGRLLLGPRAPGEEFSPADRRLLDELARQAGVAAHAVRLTADLQRSRERLVTTREEERRRLRRDLHDGLGPQLAALNVHAGLVRSLIRRDPDAADELVVEMREEIQSAVADIRRLVHELRPPALDQLGLVASLRRLATRYGAGGKSAGDNALEVTVDAPDDLPALPAAVEVAVYRIVDEALTNVVRHARARNCAVRLRLADDLLLEVADDGVGIPPGYTSGVGLVSMRERASELGGSCEVEPLPEGGTRVSVRIPMAKE